MERAKRPMLKRGKQREGMGVSGDKDGGSKEGGKEGRSKRIWTRNRSKEVAWVSQADATGSGEKTGRGRMQKKKHHRDQPDGKGRE